MIHQVGSFSATCDNCGDTFESTHEGWTLFVDEQSLQEQMDSGGWFTGYDDPEHDGKYYCRKCYKQHPEEDDKIIIDLTLKKPISLSEINKQPSHISVDELIDKVKANPYSNGSVVNQLRELLSGKILTTEQAISDVWDKGGDFVKEWFYTNRNGGQPLTPDKATYLKEHFGIETKAS